MSRYGRIKLPNELYQVVENQIVEIPTCKNREIHIDEYDADDIVSKIEKVKQVITRRFFAGAGKRHICQTMVDKGYAVLFACPISRLLKDFLGMRFGGNEIEPIDYSGFVCCYGI